QPVTFTEHQTVGICITDDLFAVIHRLAQPLSYQIDQIIFCIQCFFGDQPKLDLRSRTMDRGAQQLAFCVDYVRKRAAARSLMTAFLMTELSDISKSEYNGEPAAAGVVSCLQPFEVDLGRRRARRRYIPGSKATTPGNLRLDARAGLR